MCHVNPQIHGSSLFYDTQLSIIDYIFMILVHIGAHHLSSDTLYTSRFLLVLPILPILSILSLHHAPSISILFLPFSICLSQPTGSRTSITGSFPVVSTRLHYTIITSCSIAFPQFPSHHQLNIHFYPHSIHHFCWLSGSPQLSPARLVPLSKRLAASAPAQASATRSTRLRWRRGWLRGAGYPGPTQAPGPGKTYFLKGGQQEIPKTSSFYRIKTHFAAKKLGELWGSLIFTTRKIQQQENHSYRRQRRMR